MTEQQSSLFPTYARYPIALVKGEGSWLWDDQGNKYLDMMSGLAVTGLGHAPQAVKEALVAQLDQLWHVSNLFHIPAQEKLASLLTSKSCGDAVFLCNSGAEANEAAIKLARRYNQNVLGNGKYEIITFHQSFHGRTLATLTATGQDKVKDGFSPLPAGFVYAPYNDIEGVRQLISDKTGAIMLELVQAEGGIHLADHQFIQDLDALCKEKGLLLIVDEIQTGLGRTGKLFAYEHYGIEPDIFTLAKALGSGFPIGAMVGKEKLRQAFSAGSHATTFGGGSLAVAAAIASVEAISSDAVLENAAAMSDYFYAELHKHLDANPFVLELRGRGLLIGIACAQPVAELITEIHQRGVLVVTAGPNVIRLLPNLLVTREEADIAIAVVASVLASKAATVAG